MTELREEIARVIDPEAYEVLDAAEGRPLPGETWTEEHSAVLYMMANRENDALSKADAILKLIEARHGV